MDGRCEFCDIQGIKAERFGKIGARINLAGFHARNRAHQPSDQLDRGIIIHAVRHTFLVH